MVGECAKKIRIGAIEECATVSNKHMVYMPEPEVNMSFETLQTSAILETPYNQEKFYCGIQPLCNLHFLAVCFGLRLFYLLYEADF